MTESNTGADQKLFGIAPYLIVDDIFQSAAFYRDKLGFQFDRIWGEPPHSSNPGLYSRRMFAG